MPPLVEQVLAFNLHPERTLHPSWLPAEWPARHRRLAGHGPGAQAVLSDCLQRWDGHAALAQEFEFDTPLRRLALLDGAALRRLAAYCGFATHRAAFNLRGVGAVLRYQARRYDDDAAQFVQRRLPPLSRFAMNTAALEARPAGAGHVVVGRGYRLLLALLAAQGAPVLERVRRKLPRHASRLAPPTLRADQHEQLAELTLLCLVPERLPQWDWLF